VGSEMCIRDSLKSESQQRAPHPVRGRGDGPFVLFAKPIDGKDLVERAHRSHLPRRLFTERSQRKRSMSLMTFSRFLQRVVRLFNPFMRLVLGSRAHSMMSGRLMLLSFTGGKTGRRYTTPVSYVREGTDLLVPGGGAWWKNLTGGIAMVRLQGQWKVVTPELIREPAALSATLGRMLAANPAIALFTGIRLGPDGRPMAESLDRERRRGFVVVRLQIERSG